MAQARRLAAGENNVPPGHSGYDGTGSAGAILRRGLTSGRLTHLEYLPARAATSVPWPDWVPARLREAFAARGIDAPWTHQAQVAEHARAGRSVIVATGTASGKSVGYLTPALASLADGATTLYLAPARALAADQLDTVRALCDQAGIAGRAAVLDSDTCAADRLAARRQARYLLTTPDMLHAGVLPRHRQWHGFLRRLRYVVVDECHSYRGVFGSQVAQVLRRLRRIAAHYRVPEAPDLVFILASATISEPARSAELLTGLPAVAVTDEGAPRPAMTFALWEPPLTRAPGEAGAPARRSVIAEAADLLADLAGDGVRTLAFVRSRRGAEAAAAAARARLDERGSGQLAKRVAAYRSGYLPAERRELERALRTGAVTALATTSALELGINVTGLDAVLIAGWPGTRAALWQQAGRAGRDGRDAVAVLIARDDPLDAYLAHHPHALLHQPVESTVLDPANPYILAPHLVAAAAELPLTAADLSLFGPGAGQVADDLAGRGLLRDRGGRWHPRAPGHGLPGLRGMGSTQIKVVEEKTGRLIGTVDEPSAHVLAHAGAVYPHQGRTYLITDLDMDDGVAIARAAETNYVTFPRQLTVIEIGAELNREDWGAADVRFGDVLVTRQVRSFIRREAGTGRLLSEEPLALPPRTLRTRATWWTLAQGERAALSARGVDLPGAAHAIEHAAIGLLPLVAACDRWDVGGVFADPHPQTGRLTIFIYDGNDGGAGFAARGFTAARHWLAATSRAITGCECSGGCPSCVQSPACPDGNEPLSKPGALALIDAMTACLPTAGPASVVTRKKKRPPPGGKAGVAVRPSSGGTERFRNLRKCYAQRLKVTSQSDRRGLDFRMVAYAARHGYTGRPGRGRQRSLL